MDEADVKETRRILRLVQGHINQAALNLGAVTQTVGLVEILHHPNASLSSLNYVTPRQRTAWISARDVEQGLNVLRALDRTPRIEYIEGLFPPLFARTMLDLGLNVERETPLMIFNVEKGRFAMPSAPDGVVVSPTSGNEGTALWWYVWRNAYYDVVTDAADPVFVGQDLRKAAEGTQLDVVMYRYRFPVGVARLTLNTKQQTAQVLAMALMKEVRTPEYLRLLQASALKAAVDAGSTMIFTSGPTEADRQMSRENGFVDCGSLVCYAEISEDSRAQKDSDDDPVAQPVLTLR
jgi:hypothetical protein